MESKVTKGDSCVLPTVSYATLMVIKKKVDAEIRRRRRDVEGKNLNKQLADFYSSVKNVVKEAEGNKRGKRK